MSLKCPILGYESSAIACDAMIPLDSGEARVNACGLKEGARMAKQYPAPPPMTIDPNKQYTATMETSEGIINIELYPKEAPQHVNSFVFLSRDGYYDGVIFH